jgi:hypothetical protein
MYPDSFKEDIGSGLCCDALLAGDQNQHLRKIDPQPQKHSHYPAWWMGGPTCIPLRWIPMAC